MIRICASIVVLAISAASLTACTSDAAEYCPLSLEEARVATGIPASSSDAMSFDSNVPELANSIKHCDYELTVILQDGTQLPLFIGLSWLPADSTLYRSVHPPVWSEERPDWGPGGEEHVLQRDPELWPDQHWYSAQFVIDDSRVGVMAWPTNGSIERTLPVSTDVIMEIRSNVAGFINAVRSADTQVFERSFWK